MQVNATFNTHEAVKALKSTGFNEKQAESVVETINKAVNETVATKSDLALMGAELGGVKKTVNETVATKTDLALLVAKMATKDDIKDMATKDDIKDMATKDDIKDMATKSDLALLKKTVEDIDKNMATKDEIAKLETRMLRMMLLQTLVLVSTFGALIFAAVKLL